MKNLVSFRSLLAWMPVAAALALTTPAAAQTVTPAEEVSCGPLNVTAAQKMFRERGKTQIQVAAIYGAPATSGAAQKHTLMLLPGLEYHFIPCVYIDGETVPTEHQADYNLRLRVMGTAKNKEFIAGTSPRTAGGHTVGEGISVKKDTMVEINYGYTTNATDRPDNCLTMMIIAQPK